MLDENDIAQFQFEHSANGFTAWLTSAEDLLNGAQAVRAQVQFLGELMHSLAVVWALLLGLAIECLLKGKWVKDGNKLVEPGTQKMQKVKGAGDHELLQLADAAGFNASPEERDVLERLSVFVVWSGRYPVAMNPQKMLKRRGIAPRFFTPEDFSCAERIGNRLKMELTVAKFPGMTPL
jgi:hypothetical protein